MKKKKENAVDVRKCDLPLTALRKIRDVARDATLKERRRLDLIVREAERAIQRIQHPPKMSWIQKERDSFQDRWGMSYQNAERFWYNEVVAGRKISTEMQFAIIRHARLEGAYDETGKKPKELVE